jgi:hypothetical protein
MPTYWRDTCSCIGVFLLCREGFGWLPPSVPTLGPLRQSEVPDFFAPLVATGLASNKRRRPGGPVTQELQSAPS